MLTLDQITTLKMSHFTEAEIEHINTDLASRPQPIDLESPHWKEVLERRKTWVEAKTQEVAARNRVTMSAAYMAVLDYINKAYKQLEVLSPWMFFRAEYGKTVKAFKTDYRKAMENRKRMKAEQVVKEVYKPI